MKVAHFRFIGELKNFLSWTYREGDFEYAFNGRQSVKHLIEAAGVPHTDVEFIIANESSVGFDYQVKDGDDLFIYPPFYMTNISPLVRLRQPYSEPPRFILDNHLGRLARYLRLLGIDSLYPREHHPDAVLAQMAHDENRILLTRDRGLLMRSLVIYGYCIRTTDTLEQLTAVVQRFNLRQFARPWTRCLRCNGLLKPVAKGEILSRLQPKTKLYYEQFHICLACDQIFWKGTHFAKLQKIVQGITNC